MNQERESAISIKVAFGLSCDVERDATRESGFRPADEDLGSHKPMIGEPRIAGFAAMLRLGIAEHLLIAGGDEGRYRDEKPVVNRAEVIRRILVADYGISPERVTAVSSKSNTLGNVAIFKERVAAEGINPEDCALVTSLYHTPRALMDMHDNGLLVRGIAAEAFVLLEDPGKKDWLIEQFGGGALAIRAAEEIQGIADKVRGTYQSKTDTVPVATA